MALLWAVKVKGVNQPDRRDSTRTRVDSGGKAGHRVCAEIVREEREFELIILEGQHQISSMVLPVGAIPAAD